MCEAVQKKKALKNHYWIKHKFNYKYLEYYEKNITFNIKD